MDARKVEEAVHRLLYVNTEVVEDGGVEAVRITGGCYPNHLRALLDLAEEHGGGLHYVMDGNRQRQFLSIYPARGVPD